MVNECKKWKSNLDGRGGVGKKSGQCALKDNYKFLGIP